MRFGGGRIDLEPPLTAGLGPELELDWHQLVAPRHQQPDSVARLVLVEPLNQLIGAHAKIVNRKNLVVYVQAGRGRRTVPANLRDDEPSGVVARRRAQPHTRGLWWRNGTKTKTQQVEAAIDSE